MKLSRFLHYPAPPHHIFFHEAPHGGKFIAARGKKLCALGRLEPDDPALPMETASHVAVHKNACTTEHRFALSFRNTRDRLIKGLNKFRGAISSTRRPQPSPRKLPKADHGPLRIGDDRKSPHRNCGNLFVDLRAKLDGLRHGRLEVLNRHISHPHHRH